MTLGLSYSRPLGPLYPHPTLRFGKKEDLELQSPEGEWKSDCRILRVLQLTGEKKQGSSC